MKMKTASNSNTRVERMMYAKLRTMYYNVFNLYNLKHIYLLGMKEVIDWKLVIDFISHFKGVACWITYLMWNPQNFFSLKHGKLGFDSNTYIKKAWIRIILIFIYDKWHATLF